MVPLDISMAGEVGTADLLERITADGRPATVGTKPNESGVLPHRLYAGHAYEVVGVENYHVILRNPWGSRHPDPVPMRDFLDTMAPFVTTLVKDNER